MELIIPSESRPIIGKICSHRNTLAGHRMTKPKATSMQPDRALPFIFGRRSEDR